MIEEEIPKDVSLLRCTVKKSQQVLAKVVLYISYIIVALALLGCGYLLVTGVLIPGIIPVVTVIIAAILSIPWYYYVAGIVILAIPVYSFLWCIARELTDEDWESKEAKSVACVVAAVAGVACVACVDGVVAPVAGLAAVAAAFVAAVAIAVGVVDSKLMRFPGAVWHYYRRTKS